MTHDGLPAGADGTPAGGRRPGPTAPVRRLVDAYRLALVEGDLRSDISPDELTLLTAAVAEHAATLELTLGDDDASRTVVRGLLPELQRTPPAADLEAARAARAGDAARAVRGVLRRALAPAWAGVAVGIGTAAYLWSHDAEEARGERLVAVVGTLGVLLAAALVAVVHVSTTLVRRLGTERGSMLVRTGTVGASVERLLRVTAGPAREALRSRGVPQGAPVVLLRLRRSARSAVSRLYATTGAVAVACFLGAMHAYGWL